MGIKTKLDKLEQQAQQHYDVLSLPDGGEVRYTSEEAFSALSATINQEEHWLIPHFLRAGITTSLPGLIWALEASRERIEREGGELDGS